MRSARANSRRQVARGPKTGAGRNDAGSARSTLRGGAGKSLSIQGRSRFLKTRPSSRDAFEVSWPCTMWPTLLLGLLVASVAGWIVTGYLQRQRIRRLERSHEEIQVEETLVFDFLHGLGEAFRETIRPQELHRLIAEGAGRILDAHGAALYVADRTGGKLMPAFTSKGCPPLVDIPQDILQQAAANPITLETFLRLHTVGANEGLIGRVWQTCQAACINEFSEAPGLAKLR